MNCFSYLRAEHVYVVTSSMKTALKSTTDLVVNSHLKNNVLVLISVQLASK